MKLWKVLARNSHIYNRDKHNSGQRGGMELYECASQTFSEDSGKPPSGSQDLLHCANSSASHGLFTTAVQLRKKGGESLGIILTNSMGSSELEPCPSIASLRPGSVALNCEQLVPGDRIYSVNGITTSKMRSDDVSKLLDNIDGNALLEIQYQLPNYASQSSLCVTSKLTEVTVERSEGSLGVTLRGGAVPEHPHLSRPLTITQIRPNGPAHRSGLIRVGDRLLKVDHHALVGKTLGEAQRLLTLPGYSSLTTLTIEYDVSIMESVKYANGPLLVEIDRKVEENLGLVLTNCCEIGQDDILANGFFVEHIVPASTADRCGALSSGDQLLAIDDLSLEGWSGSTADAERLLRRATRLQVLPVHTVQRSASRNLYLHQGSDGFSTLNSRRSRNRNRLHRQSTFHKSVDINSESGGSNYCGCNGNMGVCHPETLTISLQPDRIHGYGLSISVGEHSENRSADILISRIIPDSPAYRSGCLQVGDRIISVNHQPNLTLQEINSLIELASNDSATAHKLTLHVEFDVTDTIVPSSGIFTVKLPKRGPGLGVTITASRIRPEEPFLISEIRRGSIAHRIGSLHAGDRLLAIDNRPLDHLCLESAFEILQTSTNDIVTLKIAKTETENSNLSLDSVVYTVELHRYGGPLGITISGSEDCSEPIVLSRLTEGGLAEKTGALHIGDRILAINGEILQSRPLSDAIRLLQTSGDRVQLKIARNIQGDSIDNNGSSNEQDRCNYSSPGVMSVDSAVHSWDSNTNDNIADVVTESTIKDEESVLSEPISCYQDEPATSNNNLKQRDSSQLQFYSDTEELFCPSPLPLPNYNFTLNSSVGTAGGGGNNYNYNLLTPCSSFIQRLHGINYSNESILDNEIYHVTLYKDSIYDDYGFSVSDGLYEKGVYINRIRKGGPADIVGLLKPYDRIIQVNDTKTKDFDCCLTVPLIASAGDRIELVIARSPYNFYERDQQDSMSKKSFTSQNTITKTL